MWGDKWAHFVHTDQLGHISRNRLQSFRILPSVILPRSDYMTKPSVRRCTPPTVHTGEQQCPTPPSFLSPPSLHPPSLHPPSLPPSIQQLGCVELLRTSWHDDHDHVDDCSSSNCLFLRSCSHFRGSLYRFHFSFFKKDLKNGEKKKEKNQQM